MKKNLCVLHFIYAIIFCFISMNAQAEVIGDFNYSLSTDGNGNNIAYLNSLANTSATDITIPATVTSNGIVYKVTGNIGSSMFQGNKTITSITFEKGCEISVTGYWTFANCSSLTSVSNFPKSVIYLSYTFYQCTSLTTVTFEEGSQLTLDGGTFCGCSKLTSITLPETVTSIGRSTFDGCSALTAINIPNSVTSIGQYAFSGCSALTSIKIPNAVTKIDEYTFNGCSKLASITLSDALTSIGQYAFQSCSALTAISIPNTVNYIGLYAFQYCSALSTINIPNKVTKIEDYTFLNCSKLANITLPDGLTSIGQNAFNGCSALPAINIPNKVSKIEDNTFSSCYKLASITLPDALTSIGTYAFNGCSALAAINIPNAVTTIGANAFSGCSALTAINIPNKVTTISDYAFRYCSSLSSVNFEEGSTLDSIGAGAFNCKTTEYIKVPASVTKIGNDAFGGDIVAVRLSSSTPATIAGNFCNMILVPEAALAAYKSTPVWSTLNNICPDKKYDVTIEASETTSSLLSAIGNDISNVFDLKINGSINGFDIMVMRNKMPLLRILDLSNCTIKGNPYQYYTGYYTRNDTLTGYAFYKTSLYSIVLPKDIKSIDEYALGSDYNYNSNLHYVTGLPSSCKSIRSNAFTNCNKLTNIVLGDSVSYIGYGAFQQCSSLKSITFSNTLEQIGSDAFAYCYALTDIILPNSLVSIGSYAFRACGNLTSLYIPSSVKTVGDNAFAGCDNLKTVYASTIEPISINQNTFSNYSNTILYVPYFSYQTEYYWNTQWSQFTNMRTFDPEILNAYVNNSSDFLLNDSTGSMKGDPNIELNSNSGLIVNGNINQTTNTLDVSQTSSVIGNNNLTTKELNIKMPINANQWYFFCFPYDFPLSDIKYDGNYVLRYYDGETRAEKGSGGWKDMTGTSIVAGNGYIFQGNKSGTLQVPIKNVTFNKEDKDKTMDTHTSANKQDASWNFVGNPFTSFYDINSLKLTSPITVWNGTSYEAVSPEDDDYQLAPFQAFFIQKPNDANVVGFEGDSQQTKVQVDANAVKRAARRAARRAASTNRREVINLTISGNNGEDHTRVVFNEEKTTDYDIACDAAKFMSDATAQIYSLDGKAVKYAINERPVSNGIVNLGYKAVAEGDYEIKAPRMDVPVYLKDNMTGQIIDLSTGGYQFMSEAGTFDSRFSLLSEKVATGITSAWTATGIIVVGEQGGISISGATGNVDVYSLDGKEEANCGNGFVNLAAGTYLVKYGKASTKVVVK